MARFAGGEKHAADALAAAPSAMQQGTEEERNPVLPRASIDDIPAEIQARIALQLDAIARNDDVRVIVAVESGSRAWGFASPDSDYDVRFLYVRRVEDYAALFPPRDVLEFPIEDTLDLSGWDLRKALALGLNWNPALIEWLTSPIVYREQGWEASALRRLFARPLGRDALIRHYFGLGSKQFARHIGGRPKVNLKKYFYVVRPAVALLWLEQRPAQTPPMSLPELVDGVSLPGEVVQALAELRARKSVTSEFGEGERIAALDAFAQAQLDWALARLPRSPIRLDAAQKRAAEALFSGVGVRAWFDHYLKRGPDRQLAEKVEALQVGHLTCSLFVRRLATCVSSLATLDLCRIAGAGSGTDGGAQRARILRFSCGKM